MRLTSKDKICLCGHKKHNHSGGKCHGVDTLTDVLAGEPHSLTLYCNCQEFRRDRAAERQAGARK